MTASIPGSNQLCTFALGDLLLGLDVKRVQEVLRHQPMTPVPLSSKVIRGLINLRGQIVLAIDLAYCLGVEALTSGSQSMVVVIRSEDGAASLLVDGIRDIVSISPDSYEPPPETLQGRSREFIKGAYKLPRQLLLVLDPDRILEFVSINGCASTAMIEESDA
jgi:purine-binding chemotaxis protein CheW